MYHETRINSRQPTSKSPYNDEFVPDCHMKTVNQIVRHCKYAGLGSDIEGDYYLPSRQLCP